MAQNDTDARWTEKDGEVYFWYKDPAKVAADSKIITDYAVTPTNVHDSNAITDMLDENDKAVYADSAYAG